MTSRRTVWALGAYLVGEIGAAMLVRVLCRDFPWLIRPADTAPDIPRDVVARHASRSFDPELGWCRKPGERGTEVTDTGTTSFTVDSRGCRQAPNQDDRPAPVACFGDSFVFCRLVNNDETWPFHLSQRLGEPVDNFGVGNYGIDQALLRLERELPTLPARVVVMGVVPETIARIHSYWKHYFEYGNTLAFKPRFTLGPTELTLHASPVQRPEDYHTYRDRLPEIQRLDGFYHRKFHRDILRAPYLPRLAARWRRHLPLLAHVAVGRLTGRREAAFRRAFGCVLDENARWTRRLYEDPAATALLAAIVGRFATTCREAGKEPVLVVLPQPADLDREDRGTAHEPTFARMRSLLPVVDLTPMFRNSSARDRLFAHGRLGPHPSDEGNALIADQLAPTVATLLRQSANDGS